MSVVAPRSAPASRVESTPPRPASPQVICPACERGELEVFFEIENAPVVCNVLCPTREAALAVPAAPIQLGFCASCGHIYNAAFDPGLPHYDAAYENSLQYSAAFRRYLEGLAHDLVERYALRGKHVVEIGCGQGDFLSLLCRGGGNRGTGFDPSFNPRKADTGLTDGVTILPHPFSPEHADTPADLLCCRHVLEHLPNPLAFLRQIRQTIGGRTDVVLFFEVPNALYTIERLGVWDVLYEHCSYFTPSSLRRTFESAGFEVTRIEAVYDGQFLTLEARPAPIGTTAAAFGVEPALHGHVRRFAAAYHSKVSAWRQRIDRVRREHLSAVVWGGGSKGVMFLNAVPVPRRVVPYVVDVNPRKQGQFVVGAGQAIISPAALARQFRPQVVIVMNPLYGDEIAAVLQDLRSDAHIWLESSDVGGHPVSA